MADRTGPNFEVHLTNGTLWNIAEITVCVWTAIEKRTYPLVRFSVENGVVTLAGKPMITGNKAAVISLKSLATQDYTIKVGDFIEGKTVNNECFLACLSPEQRRWVDEKKLSVPEEKRRTLIMRGYNPDKYDIQDATMQVVPRLEFPRQAASLPNDVSVAGEWRWCVLEAKGFKYP